MRRIICFVYGTTCYAIFFVTFLYLMAFLANFMVPKGIDDGVPIATVPAALIDLGLIALFGIQHSVMARPAFKKHLTAFLPESVERSTFVLAASVALIILFWQWRPMPQVLWLIQSPLWQASLWALMLAGFGIVLLRPSSSITSICSACVRSGLGFQQDLPAPLFRVTYLYNSPVIRSISACCSASGVRRG